MPEVCEKLPLKDFKQRYEIIIALRKKSYLVIVKRIANSILIVVGEGRALSGGKETFKEGVAVI